MKTKFSSLSCVFAWVALSMVCAPTICFAESLDSALISVYNKNPQLLAERASLKEVDETYVQARSQGRINITASGEYSRAVTDGSSNNTGLSLSQSDTRFYSTPRSGQINIRQPLYQGGRIKALKSQAKSNILAQRERLRARENAIFLNTATIYANVLQAEETAILRRANVRVLTQQLAASEKRFKVGDGTRTDIAQSETRLAGAEIGLAQADANLQIARAGYQRLVGRVPVDLEQLPNFEIPKKLSDVISKGRENNPELLTAYFDEETGKAAIDVAKSAGRPTLSLNANVSAARGQTIGLSQSEAAEISAQLQVPIFSGGLNASRVRQAKHAKARLSFISRDTERAVDQTLMELWAEREAARATLIATRKQVQSAQNALEGVSLEQKVGSRTQLDVLDAEQELLNSKLSAITAEQSLNISNFSLLANMGVFDSQGLRLDLDNAFDPKRNFNKIRHDNLTELMDSLFPQQIQTIADTAYDAPSLIIDTLKNP